TWPPVARAQQRVPLRVGASSVQSRSIPIYVAFVKRMAELGYEEGKNFTSGNITGLFFQQLDLAVKRAQLLRDAFPALSGVTVFWDQVSADQWQALKRAGGA